MVKSSDSGSALILVLLITALLATIAVSFLSTSRVEMIAAKNFSRQNAATGLAELATQQAMGNLQSAFNANGTVTGSYAAVVTSQPGGITKYFFQNGNCSTNGTVPLFFTANSTNANGTVNMNNLDNSTNSTISGLITGNSSEVITVARVDVRDSSGNQTIGRVAYYIDDESTKINLNSLAGQKTTLNAGYGKTQSLSGVVSSASVNGSARFSGNLTIVDSIVNGLASNSSNSITTWTSFFRPEQAQSSFSINSTQIKHYSAAPLSDFHLKYTPWGTQRLFINDEPANDTGVTNVFSSLSGRDASGNVASTSSTNPYEINGMALRNIFNGTFSDKYSINGTLQIAANMLQLKDKKTVGWNWVNCIGSMIGGANLTDSNPLPTRYFGFAPTANINEIAIQAEKDESSGRLYLCAYIELYSQIWDAGNCWYTLNVDFGGATFNSGNTTISFPSSSMTRNVQASAYTGYTERFILGNQSVTSFNGTLNLTMGNVRLLASGGNASSLRDWISGTVINNLLTLNNISINLTNTVNYTTSSPWNKAINMSSIQRKDIRIKLDSSGIYSNLNNSKTSPWGVKGDTLSPYLASSNSTPDYTKIQGSLTLSIGGWLNDNVPQNATATTVRSPFSEWGYRESGINSSDWPSDHQHGSLDTTRRYYSYQYYPYPFLDALSMPDGNGLYIRPADLGKVMTDKNFRTLRMYYQSPVEFSRGFIPDWAMLDLISFSTTNSTLQPYRINPLNLNGRFNCLPAPSSQPTPFPRNNMRSLTVQFDAAPVSTATSPFYGNPVKSSVSQQYFSSYSPVSHWGWYPSNVGVTAGASLAMSSNLTQHITSNSSNATIAWSQTTGNNTWRSYRATKGWPSSQIIIPSEITEIKQIADYYPQAINLTTPSWDGVETSENNENRLAAFFPGLTLCSNFFTIYAYAQALDKQGNIDSEALTKTLVEVEIDTPATATDGAVYKVKKLYTQPIPLGQ